MNIIDFSLKLNQFPIDNAKKHLKEIKRVNESSYQQYIQQQKQAIVTHHLANNSFYKKLVGNSYTGNWDSLPIITKKDLQYPLAERLSTGYDLKNVYVNKTSGSTGDPFYFAKDRFSHALTWAIIQDRFNWHDLYGKKQARFYGLPREFQARFKERIKDLFSNRYRFDVFDLSDSAFKEWFKKFKKDNYVYLNGYTTVIVAFANYLNSQNIILKNHCPELKACVVTSEMCSATDKQIMEKAFGVPVINEYGASELDLIAFQNEKDQWVLNTESLFIEVLDDDNRPKPYGEVGKLVISSLYNKAHPFIRYEIGDMGAIEPINDKLFILKQLEGRKEDIIRLPSGKVAPGLTFYYVTKSIMDDTGDIKEIKVIQTALDTFEIHYAAINELNDTQKEAITDALFEYLEPDLKISFLKFNQLQRSKSGKLKQFTSLLK